MQKDFFFKCKSIIELNEYFKKKYCIKYILVIVNYSNKSLILNCPSRELIP